MRQLKQFIRQTLQRNGIAISKIQQIEQQDHLLYQKFPQESLAARHFTMSVQVRSAIRIGPMSIMLPNIMPNTNNSLSSTTI